MVLSIRWLAMFSGSLTVMARFPEWFSSNNGSLLLLVLFVSWLAFLDGSLNNVAR